MVFHGSCGGEGREAETQGHIVSMVREHREINAGAQLTLLFLFLIFFSLLTQFTFRVVFLPQ